jgi:hypothetical protein
VHVVQGLLAGDCDLGVDAASPGPLAPEDLAAAVDRGVAKRVVDLLIVVECRRHGDFSAFDHLARVDDLLDDVRGDRGIPPRA